MKQRILTAALALALCLGLCAPVSAAFSDVSDPDVARAVTVLTGMGVVSGYADGGYHPGDGLTRAQFCKLAVLMENKGDQAAKSAYRTLFSDLSSAHWAAGYVNLAYEEGLVSGYGDGAFGPDDPVTAAQACTILLHILGYENADIGPFWPEDYMSKASKLGLLDGLDVEAGDPLDRGEAALLLANVLDQETAAGVEFLSTWAASTVEHALVVDADAESDNGRLHTAKVYAGGGITYYDQENAVQDGLVGNCRGTLLLDKSGKVVGFVPDETAYKTVLLSKTEADGLTDLNGVQYGIDADTAVLDLSEDEKTTWGDFWYEMDGLTAVDLGYTESGGIDLVVAAGVEKYTGTLLTGYYEDASPNQTSPSSITILGLTLEVADEGKAGLKNFSVGEKLTVELDGAGKVKAVYDAGEQKAELVGVLTAYSGTQATVELPSGLTISGTCTSSSAGDLVGGMVKATASGAGKLAVSALSGAASGKWDVAGGTLGRLAVSDAVKVYDQVGGTAATLVDVDGVLAESVPASSITYVGTNAAGQVDLIVLNDVTGNCYTYGFLKAGTKQGGSGELSYTNHTVAVENSAGTGQAYVYGSSVKNNAAGGLAVTSGGKVAGVVTLTKAEGVKRADFTGTDAVRVGDSLMPVSEDVQVYNDQTDTWTTLASAKSFSETFTVYHAAGQVRLVVVE